MILIDQIDGRDAVALVRDGQLEDLLIDHTDSETPLPGAIYRGVVGRMMKGMGGAFITLTDGQTGFLRETKGLAPVTRRVLFKSRFAIITPGKPGLNIARSIRDDDLRDDLTVMAKAAMSDAPEDMGLILRSAAAAADPEDVGEDVDAMLALATQVLGDTGSGPALLVEAPGAVETAWRDWDASLQVVRDDDAFERADVWGLLEALKARRFDLPNGAWMTVDPTRALVAVDVNTGPDQSPASADKANRAAVRALPRALRLLGLGGIVMIDFAPMPKKDRREIETMLKAAFRADSVESQLAGWSNLGLYEVQRKRERRPLTGSL